LRGKCRRQGARQARARKARWTTACSDDPIVIADAVPAGLRACGKDVSPLVRGRSVQIQVGSGRLGEIGLVLPVA